jgi:hypothetical protein
MISPCTTSSHMPAQPASNMKWNGNYVLTNNALVNMADHGGIVASVIAGWSLIEANLGRTFAILIGARQPTTMSMYLAMRSFEIQRDLLQVAVAEALPKRYAALFKAALTVLNRTAQHRHHFAHWLWGASADPNVVGLVLVEPRHFWGAAAAQIKFTRSRRGRAAIEEAGHVELAAGLPRLGHEHIFIYRLTDLREVFEQMERAFRVAEALRQLVSSEGDRRRVIYRWLGSEADIRAELEKAKKKLPQPKNQPPRARRKR